MKTNFKYLASFALFVIFITMFTACGKVSQEVGVDEEQKKSFDLNYFVEVQATKNFENLIKSKSFINTANLILVTDSPVYAHINGLIFEEKEVKFDDLSWGKGVLFLDMQNLSTKNQDLKYKSKSFDKDDIERTQPDYKWTNLKFDNLKSIWNISSTKVKISYPVYLVKIYTSSDKYLLKVLPEESITGNEKVNIGEISLYDTFLSILFLMNLNQQIDQKAKVKTLNLKEIANFYDRSFVNALKYSLPQNKIKSFDIKNSLFSFNRELEKELLDIYFMYTKDKKELLSYLNNYKKELLTKESLNLLIANIIKDNNEKD